MGESEGGAERSWLTLVLGLALLAGSALLVLFGQLVGLQNDKNHQPLLPSSVAAAGTVSGELTLTNSGLLPIEVSLEPRLRDGRTPSSFPAGIALTVTDPADRRILYDGALKATTGPLLVLPRGQSAHLRVAVTSTDLPAAVPVALPYSYYWSARAALPWWWWLPATFLIALILMVGYWRPWRGGEPR